jgi:hypothetical protein
MSEAWERAEIGSAFADIAIMNPGRCPWNPFPRNSPWGQRVDELYRQDRSRDRIRARIEQMKEMP